MLNRLLFCFGAFWLFSPTLSSAWEVDTHAWMTREVYERSLLNPANSAGAALHARLGFDRLEPEAVFRSPGLQVVGSGPQDKYFDLEPDWDQTVANPPVPAIANRFPNDWEHSRFPGNYRLNTNPGSLGATPQLRLEAWLMRGVIREDDVDVDEFINDPVPDGDPRGDITRVLGHFYDPINNDGIPDFLPFLVEARLKAINWSLGLEDALAPNFNPLLVRRNHFTWLDARRAYFKALTYQSPAATLSNAADELESEQRLFFLATSVKALGQVVHVLQDGSQPQHSRLDAHNHSNKFFLGFLNKDLPRRLMEIDTNIRVTRDINLAPQEDREPLRAMYTNEQGNLSIPAAPPMGTYPIPTFATPRRFMTTRGPDGSDPVSSRLGLMDYSNRGFFSDGTANGDNNLKGREMPLPSPTLQGFVPIELDVEGIQAVDLTSSQQDLVAPGYQDAIESVYNNRIPQGEIDFVSAIGGTVRKIRLDARHLRTHANVLIPRAISYSTGLVNFFFRGTLEIEPIEQKIFALSNQGTTHTMDANGWPRTGGGGVFGFEKVRLKVRNITEPITEPGPAGATVAQSVGSDGQLIAIARYHRNLCYRPDLSGERSQTFPAPPLTIGVITEPSCAGNAVRSRFQDISVSVPQTISGTADLPGGSGAPLPASIEKLFDFSNDPIPINATDLVIQVVYQGTLGQEPASIALGAIDVREPTIITFWNNSDYFLDTVAPLWRASNASYPMRPIQFFRFCFGPGTAERLGYWYAPPLAANAMTLSQQTRIAVIPAAPTTPTDTFRVRGQPVTSNGVAISGSMQPLTRTSRGRIAQANREFVDPSILAAPFADCQSALPSVPRYWCNDPLQRRRAVLLGAPLQPLSWVSLTASGSNTPDVANLMTDIGAIVQGGGEVRFNDSAGLANCPTPPPQIERSDEQIRLYELEEVARSFGVDLPR